MRNNSINENSPLRKGLSPSLRKGTVILAGSPNSKSMMMPKSPMKSPNKKEIGKKEEAKGLSTPTSISMKNSFIIKNADESFDTYYQTMKKKKNQMNDASFVSNSKAHENKFGFVKDTKPTARDGHSCNIDDNGFMFVFGGDRHHMSFNDLFVIRLPS